MSWRVADGEAGLRVCVGGLVLVLVCDVHLLALLPAESDGEKRMENGHADRTRTCLADHS